MLHTRLGNNLAGQYKRGIGMALQLGIGNLSAVIACNIYLAKDAPRYVLGRASSYLSINMRFLDDEGNPSVYRFHSVSRQRR